MASYVFCRVNDERHDTYEKALADLVGLVQDERYFTRNETPPKIMRRTPMVGVGAHGGRGLFVMGACAGLRWERLGLEDLPYRHRIEVIWDGVIYRADYEHVFAGSTSTTSAPGHLQRERTTGGWSGRSSTVRRCGVSARGRGYRGRTPTSRSARREAQHKPCRGRTRSRSTQCGRLRPSSRPRLPCVLRMSLFRRVTRYRISPSQNPRENRLTEVTSAVLERVDGLALEVMDAVLASAATSANERRFDAVDDVESARLGLACDSLAAQLKRLRELDRPRLRVDTQVTTASTKFVDLQLVFSPRPFEPGDTFVFWVEVKHGANVHGTQLADYEADIKVTDADQRRVIVLAPRQDVGALVGVPDLMPVVEWQAVADVVRRWTKRPGISEVERFLLTDYLAYLQEEGLMEQELLTAEHAFVLGAAPAAMNTVAKVVELADAAIAGAWGGRQSAKTRGAKPAYGLDYWGHYGPPAIGGAPAPVSWRSTNLIWGLGGDQDRAEPRDAYVFYAGATFQASRDNPAAVAENGDWLAARRTHGFEYVYFEDYWQLLRFKYPEELLVATTPDAQTQALTSWVIESFRMLANTPPPN